MEGASVRSISNERTVDRWLRDGPSSCRTRIRTDNGGSMGINWLYIMTLTNEEIRVHTHKPCGFWVARRRSIEDRDRANFLCWTCANYVPSQQNCYCIVRGVGQTPSHKLYANARQWKLICIRLAQVGAIKFVHVQTTTTAVCSGC